MYTGLGVPEDRVIWWLLRVPGGQREHLASSSLVLWAPVGTWEVCMSCPDFRRLMFAPGIPTLWDRNQGTPGFPSVCLPSPSWNS